MYLPTDLETVLSVIYISLRNKMIYRIANDLTGDEDPIAIGAMVAIGDLKRAVTCGVAKPILLIA